MISENNSHIQNMRKEYMFVVKMLLTYEKHHSLLNPYDKEYKFGIFQMIVEYIRRTKHVPSIDEMHLMVYQAILDL